MKFILVVTMLLVSSFSKADVSACRTDGCDMRRNAQVEVLLKFLQTAPQLEGRCYGLNESLLSATRESESSFVIKCGDSLKSSEAIRIGFQDRAAGTLAAFIE